MIRIEIKTDNAAFDGENHFPEILWMLKRLMGKILTYSADGEIIGKWPLLDSNGNTVGFCEFTEDSP